MLLAVALAHRSGRSFDSSDLDSPPPSPFAVGEGPFRVKGTVLWGLFEYVEERVPGGVRAVRAELPSESLREFCDQTFVAAGWYDFLSVLQILAAAGAAANMPAARFIAEHATWQAKRDVRGIHRLLIKLVSPEAVAERFPIVFARYFDFAEVTAEVEKGMSSVAVRGLPAPLLEWYKASVGAGAVAMLGLAGAKELTVAYSPASVGGAKYGVPTVDFNVVRTWSR